MWERFVKVAEWRGVLVLACVLVLVGCGSAYRAPVDELGGEERYLDAGRTHRVNAGETLYAIAWMYDLDVNLLARANDLREPFSIVPGQRLLVDLREYRGEAETASARATTARTGEVRVNPAPAPGTIQRSALPGAGLQRNPLPADDAEPAPEPRRETTVSPSPPAPVPESAPELARAAEPRDVAGSSAPLAQGPIQWAWPADGAVLKRFAESGVETKGIDIAGRRGDDVRAAAQGQVVYAGSGLLRYGDLIILKHDDHFLSAYAHNDRILVAEGDVVRRGQKIAELGSSGIDKELLHFEIRMDGSPVDPMAYLPNR